MTNILTWYAPSNNGAFQKTSELGIYSDMLAVKPTFSFSFTNMNYIEQNGTFDIDGVPMTDAQKSEVLGAINSISAPLEWYRNVKQEQYSGAYQAAIKAMAGNTDSAEMASWTKQETEARAWTADNNTLTPLIDNLLIGRNIAGETKAALVATIIAKADGYAQGYALVLGMYHAKQKQLEACTTVEQILALI
jgi:hypothetical protein